jgi:ribosomal protein S18 acetylase RimI-like enzyme
MKIRRATPSDRQDIAAVHIESWKDAYSEVLPAEFMAGQIDLELARHWRGTEIQSQDIVLVAEQDALIGFAAVWCRPVPFIDNLHVRPSCRSHNVGSALMKAAAQELIKNGYLSAYLWVFESNERAIRFYERLGGAQTDRANTTVFGYEVPSRKIEWEDLARILQDP